MTTIYSIGHSNQSMERFVELLRQHEIEVLADVRSAPYSRYVPHFNARELKAAIIEAELQYVYLGNELGGRPDDLSFYDNDGRALYDRISNSDQFNEGIERIIDGSNKFRVAMMCSEEDPTHCHRHLLVAKVLAERGVDVLHMRGDGHIDRESDLTDTRLDQPKQASLFPTETKESGAWKSTRSVLPRSLRDSSSPS